MMRYAFKADKTVTLESELNCIESFVKLQKVCYHDQLELSMEVDDCLKAICCPKFILQPVVEIHSPWSPVGRRDAAHMPEGEHCG